MSEKQVPFVSEISRAASEIESIYYGMNVSLEDEPIDQLDGFLVAKYLGAEIYPFIAGVYDCFNSQSPREARKIAKKRAAAEMGKRELLENIICNLDLDGRVFTTEDLWESDRYWDIFDQVISDIDWCTIEERVPVVNRMSIGDFPRDVVALDVFNPDYPSSFLYIPAEITEAVWFSEEMDIGNKIGPSESESIYDDLIKQYGLEIIGLTQPEYVDYSSVCPEQRICTPYRSWTRENRVGFSDTVVDVSIKSRYPQFQRAVQLADFYWDLFGLRKAPDIPRVNELIKLGDFP